MNVFVLKPVFSALRLALLVLLLGTTSLFFGQAEQGTIVGVVRDVSGAVVDGATISVQNVDTAALRTATSNNLGEYRIADLPPAKYEVTVSKSGFESYKVKTEVTVGAHLTVDAQLKVGSGNTIVEVVAGSTTEVNTQTQEISQLIDSQQIAMLPSLTRNPYDFVALAGNVSGGDSTTPNAAGSQNQQGRGTGYSINGQRESGTEILLDGIENENLFAADVGTQIPVDSVQEYSVITNNFGSEYGRASGGVVNLTTKAGSNNWHGSVWEFNRLAAYTANTFNNNAHELPKGEYTRNQFGAQGGGPLMKNKLFVYNTIEWLRVRSQPTQIQEVLDPGFVSLLPQNIQNYFSSYGQGATGLVPGSCSNGLKCVTAGQLAAAGAPIPNINGITPVSASQPVFDIAAFKANFDAGGDVPQNTYRYAGRLDYNLSDKTQMFFRYARDDESQFLGTNTYTAYPQYDVGTSVLAQNLVFSVNHEFNSSLVNNTKVGFSRFNDKNTFNTALTFTPNLILTNFAADPTNGNSIQFPGLQNLANGLGGLPAGGPINTLQFEHDLSWTKGRHNMKFGGQFSYIQLNYTYGAYAQAVEYLGGSVANGLADLANQYGNQAGGVYASPVLNFTNRVNAEGALPCVANPDGSLVVTSACTITPPLSFPDSSRSYRYKDWALFAQDSFRLTPRLTLNYGLRYEHYGVQHNVNPSIDSNFYFGPGSGVEQQVRTGQVQIANKSSVGQFWAPTWGTVGPRVGFAYDMFGDGKTSLRGGFGISYERNFGNVTFNASFNPPQSAAINANSTNLDASGVVISSPYVVTNADLGPLGLPPSASNPPNCGTAYCLPPVELRMPNPHINTAQTQFWSLDIQRELAKNTVIDVGYSGAHGVHLYDLENINQLGSGQFYLGDSLTPAGFPGCTTSSPCFTRANQQYAAINMRGSLGNSSYSALNLKFQTQDLHKTGLSLVANYTWSHSLDDLSSTFSDSLQGGSGAIGSLGYTDPFHPLLDWGSSDFNIKHRIVLSPIWELPWYRNKGGIGEALGGWTLTGIFTARTGTPFSVYDYTNVLNGYTVPRETPSAAFSSNHVSGPTASNLIAPNLYGVLSVPVPAEVAPLDPAIGISDFGPFPAGMMHRNSIVGPGAWNLDAAVQKNFRLTERFGLEFRAEGFNIFNHHNLYVNTGNLGFFTEGPGAFWAGASTSAGVPEVTALKGGLNTLALGGNHDERRFGQFSLRLTF